MSLASEVEKHRYEMFFPKELPWVTRAWLWARGYRDARKGNISIIHDVSISSNYIVQLTEAMNLRINAEWQNSNGAMFEIKPLLEAAIEKYADIKKREAEIERWFELKLERMNIPYEGDNYVSAHLQERRINRRKLLVAKQIEEDKNKLASERRQAREEVDILLARLQDCRDIAQTHERVVRADYVARLSAYARGAARKQSFSPEYINDFEITNEPQDNNYAIFSELLNFVNKLDKDNCATFCSIEVEK